MANANQENTMKAAEVTNLASLTDYVADSIISRTLVKNEAGNLTYMAFGAGQGLSKHSAPFDAFVQALDGKATILIDDKEHALSAGDWRSGEASGVRRLNAKKQVISVCT